MTTAFVELTDVVQGAICTLFLLLLCAGMWAAMLAAIHRAPAMQLASALFPCAVDFIALTLLLQAKDAGATAGDTWALPLWALVLLIALSAAWILLSLRRQLRWQRSHVTRASVKEAFDQLPTGLCYYVRDGRTQLVNHRMNALCRLLMGSQLSNGEVFWDSLIHGDVLPDNCVLQAGDAPIVELADGQVWSFERSRIDACGAETMQIIASDITREYRMNQELEAQNRRLEEMNGRLRGYSSTIRELTREKETLAAKLRIHDGFGQALLATRRLRAHPSDAQQRTEVLRMWRQNLRLMEHMDAANPSAHGFAALLRAAEAIGMHIAVDGSLPPESAACASLLESAAHECLTNAARHAGSTQLFMRIDVCGGRVRAEFTNDGAVPSGAVSEGGGLSALRRSVESAGGRMRLESLPRFRLILDLPQEREDWT